MIGLIRLRSTAIVIVVSARDDGAEKVTALDLGADDYVTKPFDTEELLARIRTALRHLRTAAAGEQVSVVEAGAVRIDLEHRRVLKDEREVHLTPKEYAVLAALARRPDRRSEEHTSELQSLMLISSPFFCLLNNTKLH